MMSLDLRCYGWQKARQTGLPLNGDLTEMLKVLEQCDFIRTYAMPGKVSRGRLYQLIDNFTLFYLRCGIEV